MSHLDLPRPRSTSRPVAARIRRALAAPAADDFVCEENPLEHLGLEGAASDPAPRHLFREALALYEAANRDYLAGRHNNPSILLASAKRNSRHQALLYVRWFWWRHTGGAGEGVPTQNEANAPGKSFHEYGFAIDVIRGGEDRRIQSVLRTAGWMDGIEREGWHFEAAQAPAMARLTGLIAAEAMPLSDAYKGLVSDFLYTRQTCRGLLPDFRRERTRLQADIDRMQQQKADLDREKTRLETVRRSLDTEEADLRRRRDLAVRHRRDYTNMRYTLCENGEPYESCTHTDLKRLYDRQKAAALAAVEAEERDVRRRQTALDGRVRTYDVALRTHNNNVGAWERYKIDWERRNRTYVGMRDRIARMDTKLLDLGRQVHAKLMEIERIAASILRRL